MEDIKEAIVENLEDTHQAINPLTIDLFASRTPSSKGLDSSRAQVNATGAFFDAVDVRVDLQGIPEEQKTST